MSTTAATPKASATVANGWARRASSRGASPTVTSSDSPRQRQVLAQRGLQQAGHRHDGHQCPVPPHPHRRRWRLGLVQHGSQLVAHHLSVGNGPVRGDRPKGWFPLARRYGVPGASRPMCRDLDSTTVEGLVGHRAPADDRGDHHVPRSRTAGPLRRPTPVAGPRGLGGGRRPGRHLRGCVRPRAGRPVRGTRPGLAPRHRAAREGGFRRRGTRRRRRPHAARSRGDLLRLPAARAEVARIKDAVVALPKVRATTDPPAPCGPVAGPPRVGRRLAGRPGRADPGPVPRARGPGTGRPGEPQDAPRRPPRHVVAADRSRR